MTHSQPVARVVKLLQANGYELANGPLRVGTLSFEFAATLFGTAHSFDMVLVDGRAPKPGWAGTSSGPSSCTGGLSGGTGAGVMQRMAAGWPREAT